MIPALLADYCREFARIQEYSYFGCVMTVPC